MVMSDRIALLRSGELEQVATPREIYSRPATSYAAQFIGHTNLLRADVRAGVAQCACLGWPVQLTDGPTLFSLRPENLRVVGTQAAGKSTNTEIDPVRVRGKVVHRAFHGATDLIRVECDQGLVLVARTASGGNIQHEVELEFSPAEAVTVRESPRRN
jgi:ABC-type Fe3+/spermidine/putrescine transport system ATPase subunit